MRPHLKFYVQLWDPQHTYMDLLERVQERPTKMLRGLMHLSHEDRLRDLGFFSLQKNLSDTFKAKPFYDSVSNFNEVK